LDHFPIHTCISHLNTTISFKAAERHSMFTHCRSTPLTVWYILGLFTLETVDPRSF